MKSIKDLPSGTWMTWTDRCDPILIEKLEDGWLRRGFNPPIGTEVVRIVWKGSSYTADGQRGETRETLIYNGISDGDLWTRKHIFKKKK